MIEQLYRSRDFITEKGYNLINHSNFINSMTEKEIGQMDATTKLQYEITKNI